MTRTIICILLLSILGAQAALIPANALNFQSPVKQYAINKESKFISYHEDGKRYNIYIGKCNEWLVESFWQDVLEKMLQKNKMSSVNSNIAAVNFMGINKKLSRQDKNFQYFSQLPKQYFSLQKQSKKLCNKS